MRKENKIDLFRLDVKLLHVGEQNLAIFSRIEEYGFFQSMDITGKSPVSLQSFFEWIVIVNHSQSNRLINVHRC
jgi:hypothetical protein